MAPWDHHYQELCDRLDAHRALLERIASGVENQHSPVLREWEILRDVTGGQTDSTGAVTVQFNAVPLGWEWEVRRIAVTVGGASSSATFVAYVNGVADSAMVDFSSSLFGNSPSRNVSDNSQPILMVGGDVLFGAVTGAVASQPVTVRIEGRRREL